MKKGVIITVAVLIIAAIMGVIILNSGNSEIENEQIQQQEIEQVEETVEEVEELPAPEVEEEVEEVIEEGPTTHTVNMNDFAFEPATITIKQGDTINWINNGKSIHYVLSIKGSRILDSKNVYKEGEWSYTFDEEEPGKYEYFSPVYDGMFGVIIIE